jgi:hypothetical protein
MAILACLVVTKNGLNGPIQGLRSVSICLRKTPFIWGYPVINIAHPTGYRVKKVIFSDHTIPAYISCRKNEDFWLIAYWDVMHGFVDIRANI